MTQQPATSRSWQMLALTGAAIVIAVFGLMVPQWITPPSEQGSTAAPSLSPILMRLGVATAMVLALCAIAAKLFGRRFGASTPSSDELELLEVMPLRGFCRVHLVRAGDQLLLAGLDGSGLKSLVHLPDEGDEQ